VFETAASANWATGARGASGGQRSRNLRDVDAALCRLSYAGLVGPQRFELWSACYKQAALTVELQAVYDWWAGEDSHLYSNAALLQSVGLAHAQPAHRLVLLYESWARNMRFATLAQPGY
jgi:hypothetical protein